MDDVEIRRLDGSEAREHLGGLAEVLRDCVEDGSSVGFMAPFPPEEAEAAFAALLPEVESGRRILLAAFAGGAVVGTVQLVHAGPPNQPHRGDVAKLLVRRSARRRGIARRLMERLEAEAVREGKTLLVLDTVTGDAAEFLYDRLGWTRLGTIPRYALYPDGRPCATTVFWKELAAGADRRSAAASSRPGPTRAPRRPGR